jgi:hypothetical protein
MSPSLDALIPLLRTLYTDVEMPEPFDLLAGVHDHRYSKRLAEPIADKPDRRLAMRAKRVATLLAAPDALQAATDVASGSPLPEKLIARAETMLGQLLLGRMAEHAFENIYRSTIGTTELSLHDERGARNDTDYRVLNGSGRQVFRINIKLHGARFRKAQEAVGLDPEDCFPLATYKIHQGLIKQEREGLPYLWVVIDCPVAATDIGKQIPRPLVELIALAYASKRITGKRKIEERVVDYLVTATDHAFAAKVADLRAQLAKAPWRVISARRADKLLREKLFDRVFAVRIRSFNRSYGGAELNMHLSLSQDMTPLKDFLQVMKDKGLHGVTAGLERGTI